MKCISVLLFKYDMYFRFVIKVCHVFPFWHLSMKCISVLLFKYDMYFRVVV